MALRLLYSRIQGAQIYLKLFSHKLFNPTQPNSDYCFGKRARVEGLNRELKKQRKITPLNIAAWVINTLNITVFIFLNHVFNLFCNIKENWKIIFSIFLWSKLNKTTKVTDLNSNPELNRILFCVNEVLRIFSLFLFSFQALKSPPTYPIPSSACK